MCAVGLSGLQESDLQVDGKIHRFRLDDSNKKHGWYVLREYLSRDNKVLLYGACGDYRAWPTSHKIEPGEVFRLSDDEREAFKKERDRQRRDQKRKQQEKSRRAALRAQKVWSGLDVEGVSPYLARKQVQAYGVRYSTSGAMAIPMMDMSGEIHGLQVIHKDKRLTQSGEYIDKDFWPYGASPSSHFHLIGGFPEQGASRRVKIGICEGYATGASIHEASGLTVFVAFNVGNLGNVARLVRGAYPDAEIYLFADDDYQTLKPVENPGVTEARKVAKAVNGKAVIPRFTNRGNEKWTDFNDLHVAEGLDAVRDQILRGIYTQTEPAKEKKGPIIEVPPGQEWQWKFSRTQMGNIRADVNNVKLILMNDERWMGVLQYNEFDYDIHKLKMPPFEDNPKKGDWDEVDTERLRCWLGEHYEFTPSEKDAIAAVRVVAENNAIHPIKNYLESLIWDKTDRLDFWLSDYLGVEKTEYSMKVSSKFMIGAVARVYARKGFGVKMDTVLILEGMQGKGKSSTAEAMCGGEWFSETQFELGSKEGYQQLRGVWWQELPELDAFNKAESTRAKGFFSTKEDYYRPAYGRKATKFPRQCVFIGTTNQEHYLKDVTGNRRYWPVFCTEINVKAVREARDQLWAEAYYRYKQGEIWWLTEDEKPLFEAEQDKRLVEDTWETRITAWLYHSDRILVNKFTTAEIMEFAIPLTPDKHTPPNQTRVGMIMSSLGWKKIRRRVQKKGAVNGVKEPEWFYERPSDERVTSQDFDKVDDLTI